MKQIFGVIVLLGICSSRIEASESWHKHMTDVINKCVSDFKVEETEVAELLQNSKEPNSDNGKCAIGCYVKEMGYFQDGKFDLEKIKADNKCHWASDEHIELANNITETCVNSVVPEDTECEAASKLIVCILSETDKAGIGLNDAD